MPADSIPAELSAACAQVRAATPADKIGGVQAKLVVAPASTAEASAVLKACSGLGLTVVPRGSGTKLHWGAAPERADVIVELTRMNQVLEHEAGDLVASVEAGVTLGELAQVLGQKGQRLALDLAATGTVGGVLATNVAGPLRLRYGAPRDLLIGITVVRADGTVARSGGKVVKNVAGYDLGKLFAGSRGALGLITGATFRLHPIPPGTTYVVADCKPDDCSRLLQLAVQAKIAPVAAELDWAVLQTDPADEPVRLAVALEGDQAGVAQRATLLTELIPAARVAEDKPPWWGALPAGHPTGTLLQLAFWTGDLAETLDALRAAAHQAGLRPAVGGSAAAGLLHVAVPAGSDADKVANFVTRLRADLSGKHPPRSSVVVLHAPAPIAQRLDLFGPVPALNVMRAVKQQFDPERLMSPGRFAGGL